MDFCVWTENVLEFHNKTWRILHLEYNLFVATAVVFNVLASSMHRGRNWSTQINPDRMRMFLVCIHIFILFEFIKYDFIKIYFILFHIISLLHIRFNRAPSCWLIISAVMQIEEHHITDRTRNDSGQISNTLLCSSSWPKSCWLFAKVHIQ